MDRRKHGIAIVSAALIFTAAACDRGDPNQPQPVAQLDGTPDGGAPDEDAADSAPPHSVATTAPADTTVADPGSPLADTTADDETAGSGDPDETASPELTAPEVEPLPPPLFNASNAKCGGARGVGQKAKSFKLPSTTGKTISPAYYRGRVVLLNFWGTWCKPCLEELPEFSRLYRRYRKHGLTLVAVATDDDKAAVEAAVAEHKISAKVAYGGEATAASYGDRNFPFSFVIGSDGTIRAAYDGYKEGCIGALERDIRDQLEKRNR